MAKKRSSIGFDPLAWMKGGRPSPVAGRQSDGMHRSPSVEISPPIPQTDDRRPATSDSPVVIALGDSLAIGDVRARHSDWKAHLANARAIEIDGAALGKVDTAALQLLVALVQDARGRGVPVKWRGVSNALREGAARLGVTPFLQLS